MRLSTSIKKKQMTTYTRRHPRHAEVDPNNPQAWGRSDRDGKVGNLANMRFQHEWRGPRVVNTKMLIHKDELDVVQRQLGLPAPVGYDGLPKANARIENYAIDEYPVSTRVTMDGSVRVISSGPSPYPTYRIVSVEGGAPDSWNGP